MVKNCLSECWEMDSPPPDSILWLPPPPVPQLFAKELLADTEAARNSNVAAASRDGRDASTTVMSFTCGGQFCDWFGFLGGALIGGARDYSNAIASADDGDEDGAMERGDGGYRQSVVRAANNFILQNSGDNWPLNDAGALPGATEAGPSNTVWFLVLILAAIFSVVVASLLAMFLLKVKEFISKVNGYPLRTGGDGSATLAASMTLTGSTNYGAVMSLDGRGRRPKTAKKIANHWSSSSAASTATMSSSSKDERYLWTTLTPKGQTHHYLTSRNINDGTTTTIGPVAATGAIYQGGFNFAAAAAGMVLGGGGPGVGNGSDIYENAYEQIIDRSSNYCSGAIGNGGSPLTSSSESPSAAAASKPKKTGQNFIEYSYYEDPTPLIESYQLSNMENRDVTPPQSVFSGQQQQQQQQRRNDHFGTLKSNGTKLRVSTPTRIDNPNLPPLNLYPTNRLSTLRRQY